MELNGVKLWKRKPDVDINSLAPCGLICGLCKDIHRECKGCRNEGTDQNCFQFSCCRAKGIAGCWECESFPCGKGYLGDEKRQGIMIGFTRCIKVVGPYKFYNDVKSKLGSSINYSEYFFISEQNIISMFYD